MSSQVGAVQDGQAVFSTGGWLVTSGGHGIEEGEDHLSLLHAVLPVGWWPSAWLPGFEHPRQIVAWHRRDD